MTLAHGAGTEVPQLFEAIDSEAATAVLVAPQTETEAELRAS